MNRKIVAISAICISLTLSGCGMWEGLKNWSNKTGEKMPVSGERCEGRWFCFGGGNNQQNQSSGGEKRPANYPEAGAQAPARPDMMPGQPVGAPGVAPPHLQPGMIPPPPPGFDPKDPRFDPNSPQFDPRAYPLFAPAPQNQAPGGQGQVGQGNGGFVPPSMPPGMIPPSPSQVYPADQQMKPWEENPEWKGDLPEGEPQIEQLKRDLEW